MPVKISRILHAGYLFECESTQILFDPLFENPFSRNCYAFPEVEFDVAKIKQLTPSAIFISHYHDDHCSFESLNLIDRRTPIYMYCIFEEMFLWLKELGFESVYQLKLNEAVNIGSFTITPRKALDEDVDSIFHIQVQGLNILNVVDSWIDDETLKILVQTSWDMILWPFQTMREVEVITPFEGGLSRPAEIPTEWIQQLKLLNPRYLVPSSCQFKMETWSWYNQAFFPISYQYFNEVMKINLKNTDIVRLNPGVSGVLNQETFSRSTSLSWIKPIGDQNEDYQHNTYVTPPTTAEIAKNFRSLTKPEMQKISDYCKNSLIKKYSAFECYDDFFFTERKWKLTIYTSDGSSTVFCYLIQQNKIRLTDNILSPDWSTEIIAAKFLSALESGESLSSMYLRISNIDTNVDITQDPLLRCLFDKQFGSYQYEQLRAIKNNSV